MFVLSLISTEYRFLHTIFSEVAVIDLLKIDKFSTHFSKCPVSFPVILAVTYSKIGKNMGTLGKFSTYFMAFNICFDPKLHFVSL